MKKEVIVQDDVGYTCPGCGDWTELSGGEKFCPECGQKLDWSETHW